MSHACTPILVAEPALVSKGRFSLVVIGPWSSKILIDRNQPKKFIQVGVDVTCMHTNFGGRTISGFGDIGTFKNGQISLSTMDYSPWSSKNLIDRNWPKKSCK